MEEALRSRSFPLIDWLIERLTWLVYRIRTARLKPSHITEALVLWCRCTVIRVTHSMQWAHLADCAARCWETFGAWRGKHGIGIKSSEFLFSLSFQTQCTDWILWVMWTKRRKKKNNSTGNPTSVNSECSSGDLLHCFRAAAMPPRANLPAWFLGFFEPPPSWPAGSRWRRWVSEANLPPLPEGLIHLPALHPSRFCSLFHVLTFAWLGIQSKPASAAHTAQYYATCARIYFVVLLLANWEDDCCKTDHFVSPNWLNY